MDQQAFRQLLSTSGVGGGAGGSSSSGNTSINNGEDRARMFGVAKKRRPIASTASATTDMRPRKLDRPANQPENQADKGKQKSGSGTAYLDRAEARRQGKEDANEFHEVEALREDFEKRIADAKSEEEKTKLREQMAFLGGDAKHSVLVKGLDFALLEQQRAKAAGRLDSGKDDEELEAAFGRPDKGETSGKDSPQSSRMISSKFKPIAAKSVEDKETEAPEYIWRDGKRMRKKKKKRKDEEEKLETEDLQVSVRATTADAELEGAQKPEKKAKIGKVVKKPKAQVEKPGGLDGRTSKDVDVTMQSTEIADTATERGLADESTEAGDRKSNETREEEAKIAVDAEQRSNVVDDDEDDDEDIFADAGRWQGLDDDSDKDEENDRASAANIGVVPGAGAGKRDWFAKDLQKEDEEEAEGSELPGALNHIVANARAAHEAANLKDDQREEEEESGRLQGFSNSKLDSQTARLLLERDQDDPAGDGKKKKGGGKKRKKSKKDANDSEDDDED